MKLGNDNIAISQSAIHAAFDNQQTQPVTIDNVGTVNQYFGRTYACPIVNACCTAIVNLNCGMSESEYGAFRYALLSVLGLRAIACEEGKPRQLFAFPSMACRDAGKHGQWIKAGKLIRSIVEGAHQERFAEMVAAILRRELEDLDYTGLKVIAAHGACIATIYKTPYSRAKRETWNPSLHSVNFKPLDQSCMRHNNDDYESAPYHPCDAYGTDSFVLFYALDAENNVLARQLFGKNDNGEIDCAAPIYATNSKCIEAFRAGLEAQGVDIGACRESFTGKRLARLHSACGDLVAPYLDSGDCIDTDSMVICSYGGASASSTNGILENEDMVNCDHCNHSMHIEDSMYDPSGYTAYCESCYCDLFTSCVECDETIDRDNAREGTDGESYCECCFNDTFGVCERDYDTCRLEDMEYVTLASGHEETWGPDAINDHAIYSDYLGHNIELSDAVQTICGNWIYADDSDVVEWESEYYLRGSEELESAKADYMARVVADELQQMKLQPCLPLVFTGPSHNPVFTAMQKLFETLD